jgi:hypothetical protein
VIIFLLLVIIFGAGVILRDVRKAQQPLASSEIYAEEKGCGNVQVGRSGTVPVRVANGWTTETAESDCQ